MTVSLPRCALVVCLTACASAPSARPTQTLTPERLYPLHPGGAWSYDVDPGDGTRVLAITRVLEADAAHALVQGGQDSTRYELRPDGIYRSARGAYLLKAPIAAGAHWPSGPDLEAMIRATDVTIDTPAGRFAGCVEVLEQGAASGASISTTYCPDIGPVQVISSMELTLGGRSTVRVTARLRGYSIRDPAALTEPGSAATPGLDRTPR
jgi:hypothetical protein